MPHKQLEKNPPRIETVNRDTGEVKLKVRNDGVKAYKVKVDSEHGVDLERYPKGDRERTRGRPKKDKGEPQEKRASRLAKEAKQEEEVRRGHREHEQKQKEMIKRRES